MGSPKVDIESAPPFVRDAANAATRHRLEIIAATPEYLLLTPNLEGPDWSSGKVADTMTVFIHDRVRDRWKTIQAEGNQSRLKLFGPWLEAIVGAYNPGNKKQSPGYENERHVGGAGGHGQGNTARLPNVQAAYGEALVRPTSQEYLIFRISTTTEGSAWRQTDG